jgi:hypothetical protein
MSLPTWFPRPAAWVSAGLLLLLSLAWSAAMGAAVRFLLELARHSPRLALVGGLLGWLSPIPLVAFAHRALHAVLDLGDTRKVAATAALRRLSVWAGLYAWFVIVFASTVTAFVLLILSPPKSEPEAVRSVWVQLSGGGGSALYAGVWLAVAAALYHFEGAVRERGAA